MTQKYRYVYSDTSERQATESTLLKLILILDTYWLMDIQTTLEDKWRFSSVSETVILQAKQQQVEWNLIVQTKNIIVHRQLPENISVHFLICRSIEYWTESLLNYNIYYSLLFDLFIKYIMDVNGRELWQWPDPINCTDL